KNTRNVFLRRYCHTPNTTCGRVVVEDVSLFWEIYGQGPHPVLCIPGLAGSTVESFHPVWNLMSPEKYTLVGIDPPGQGRSYPPEVDLLSEELYTWKHARMANALMTELGYDKFSVLGWSNGGSAALVMGGAFPNRINKVICCNSPYRATKKTLRLVQAMTNLEKWPPDLRRRLVDFYGEAYLRKMLQNQVDFVIDDGQPHRDRMYKCVLEFSEKNFRPTLMVAGLKDMSWNPEEAECIRNTIRDCRLVTFPNCGHSHLEFVEDLVRISEEFLDE
ncbi:unnamed protein product, partial [Allacma fusca]